MRVPSVMIMVSLAVASLTAMSPSASAAVRSQVRSDRRDSAATSVGGDVVDRDRPSALRAPAGDLVVDLTLGGASEGVARQLVAAGGLAGRRSTGQRDASLAAASPASGDRGRVLRWALSQGLRVVGSTAWQVEVAGRPGSLARLLGTRLGVRLGVSGRPELYPLRPLTVPRVLRSSVSAATGLDQRPVFRRLDAGDDTGVGVDGADLRAAYGMSESGGDGAGLTVADVEFSKWSSSDLTTYADRNKIDLSPGQITVIDSGTSTPGSELGGGATEVSLDAEAVLAVAPAAKQRIYESGNSLAEAVGLYEQIAADARAGLVQVVTTSWGACELPAAADAALHQAMLQIVAAGATVLAASGDDGPDCFGLQRGVTYPASDPAVVSVGGTRLTQDVDGDFSERPWVGTPSAAGPVGSGGGTSVVYARPSYQHALPARLGTGRLVPDIASDADPATGFATYQASAGGWLTVGGTSLAAPTQAALLADALSAAGRSAGVGDIHAALYSAPQDDFRDVVSGSDGSHSAGPGFDLLTGRGSPSWSRLVQALGLPRPSLVARPARPGQPEATAADRSVTVQWAGVPDPDPAAPVIAYRITAVPADSSKRPHSVTVGAGSTSASVGDLSAIPYTVTLVAINAAGSSALSPPSAPVTPTAAPADPGTVSTVFGGTAPTNDLCYYTDPRDPSIDDVSDLAFGPDGALYGVDDDSVFRLDLHTHTATTVAGTCAHAVGQPSGDGGPATQANLSAPDALAFDARGDLYIGAQDSRTNGGQIRRVDADSGIITTVPGAAGASDPGPLGTITALTVAPDGTLYVADQTRVFEQQPGGALTVLAGGGLSYLLQDAGQQSAISVALSPRGLAVGPDGNLYVSSNAPGDMVARIDARTDTISVAAGSPVHGVPGQGNGDGGPLSGARFNDIGGLHFGPDGDLYVSDLDDWTYRRLDLVHNDVETVAGHPPFDGHAIVGDGGPALDATIDGPFALAADGDAYFGDTALDSIRRVVDLPTAPTEPTQADPLPSPAPTYSVSALNGFQATLLSPSGELVGRSATTNQPLTGSIDGSVQALAAPQGFLPQAVSANGAIAGIAYSISQGLPVADGYLIDHGTVTALGVVNSIISVTSDDTVLATGVPRPISPTTDGSAATWHAGRWTFLDHAAPTAMNDAEEVIGDSSASPGATVPQVWCGTHDYPLVTSGHPSSTATAISPSGLIAGIEYGRAGNRIATPVWSQGTHTDLEPVGPVDLPTAVNDAGDVVGNTDDPSFEYAVRWHNGHREYLDNDIDPDLGIHLSSADGIDQRGDILAVGTYGSYVVQPTRADTSAVAAGSAQPGCSDAIGTPPHGGNPLAPVTHLHVSAPRAVSTRMRIELQWTSPQASRATVIRVTRATDRPQTDPPFDADDVYNDHRPDGSAHAHILTIDDTTAMTVCLYAVDHNGGLAAPTCATVPDRAQLLAVRDLAILPDGTTPTLRWTPPVATGGDGVVIRRVDGQHPATSLRDGTSIRQTTPTTARDRVRLAHHYCYTVWSVVDRTAVPGTQRSRCFKSLPAHTAR